MRYQFWILSIFLALGLACSRGGTGSTSEDVQDSVAREDAEIAEDGGEVEETSGEIEADLPGEETQDASEGVQEELPPVKDRCIEIPSDLKPGLYKEHGVYILVLKGTPYEMGRQHARLMKDQLKEGIEYLKHSSMGLLIQAARNAHMDEMAMQWSYPEVIQECQGMSDESGGEWDVETCVGLAFGDVILDAIKSGHTPKKAGPGCSEFVVSDGATKDGTLLHGRNLDWDRIEYLLKYPTIIVRVPQGGIPNMTIGFPGNVAPYTGINACGVSVGMDEAYSRKDVRPDGRSHTEMLRLILERCHDVQEVEDFLRSQRHASAEIIIAADPTEGRVFELTATHIGVRKMEKGVVFATNHFVDSTMQELDVPHKNDSSTIKRYERLKQLLDPDSKDTLYGTIDVEVAASILGDRHDPYTGEEYGTDVFDNDSSLATNGNIYSMVFVNSKGIVYLAHGDGTPVPNNPYYGFSLACILKVQECEAPQPSVVNQ